MMFQSIPKNTNEDLLDLFVIAVLLLFTAMMFMQFGATSTNAASAFHGSILGQ